MARVMIRAGEVRDNFEADAINVEKYVKELAALMRLDQGRWKDVRAGALEDDQHGVGDPRGRFTPVVRRRSQGHERDNGAQSSSKPAGGEPGQRLVQTMAPEVHHHSRPNKGGL